MTDVTYRRRHHRRRRRHTGDPAEKDVRGRNGGRRGGRASGWAPRRNWWRRWVA